MADEDPVDRLAHLKRLWREPTDEEVIETMLVLGGSFMQALALAFQRADPNNQRRLKMAFLEEWNEYRALARLAQGKGR